MASMMPMPDPVPPWARGNPSSWPAAVTSQSDLQLFVELMTGCNKDCQVDLSDRLPQITETGEDVSDCFLVFLPAASRPPLDLLPFVEPIQEHWKQKTTSGIRDRAVTVGNNLYRSVQLSRQECACKYNFRGSSDSWTKVSAPDVVPSSRCPAGQAFQKALDGFIERNVQRMARAQQSDVVLNAWWRRGSWHCLLNTYISRNHHAISFHADDAPPTYETKKDPVVSYSYGAPCPLYIRHTMTAKKGNQAVPVLLVQRDGDALMMGGAFQKKFERMVPSLSQWLAPQPANKLEMPFGEKTHVVPLAYVNGTNGLEEDRADLRNKLTADPAFSVVRYNVNFRWHRKHLDGGCPYKEREPLHLPQWQAPTEGLVQKRTFEELACPRVEPELMKPAPTMQLSAMQGHRSDVGPLQEPFPAPRGTVQALHSGRATSGR